MFWGLEYQARMGTTRIRMQQVCGITTSCTVQQISIPSVLAVDLLYFDLTAKSLSGQRIGNLYDLDYLHLMISVDETITAFFMCIYGSFDALGAISCFVLFAPSVSVEALARVVSSFVAL